MKLKFTGCTEINSEGIEIFGRMLNFEIASDGITVILEQRPGTLEVGFSANSGFIRFDKKIHFYRGLGLFIENLRKCDSFHIIEHPQFDMDGVMADVSRNAVLKVQSIKLLLEKMAVMGLDTLMLYTEDTYKVEGLPYFGYMRGSYSYQELKECDDYADIFGIEIIPCIQTLAHIDQALKWNFARDIKDTEDILLVGSQKTYEFLEKLIKAITAPFRSKKIHLGMDEAHFLGLGKYLDKHGYRRRFDIMSEHLRLVTGITDKYGLEPMIWSDMYFRLGSKTGDYYDMNAVIPEDVPGKIPPNLQLVYWDYYHNDEDSYLRLIKSNKQLKQDIIFAGGIWTWNGICVNYGKTFVTTNAAMKACKKEGVKKVIATMWGDNGAETNIFSALLGLQLFAEHGYSPDIDMDKLNERFEFCTGGSAQAFLDISFINQAPGAAGIFHDVANPPKYILWQDILTGLFDKHLEGLDLNEYYSVLETKFKAYAAAGGQWSFIFKMLHKLCSVLSLKSGIGIELKAAYDSRDKNLLGKIAADSLPKLYNLIEELRAAHREQWFNTYKPFGWEILDIRYGGLMARVSTAQFRINEFVTGNVDFIEELEEDRLWFDNSEMPEGKGLGHCNLYHRIISASPIG